MKFFSFLLIIFFALTVRAQTFQRDFPVAGNIPIQITNLYGRVSVTAAETKEETVDAENAGEETKTEKIFLTAENANETDLKIVADGKRLEITAAPADAKKRIDLTLKIPAHLKIKIETGNGEARLEGDFESAEVKTEVGTIAANVPLDDVRYNFVWTDSRPRFLSDVKLEDTDEKAAGKFVVNGKINQESKDKTTAAKIKIAPDETAQTAEAKNDKKPKTKNRKPKTVRLNFTTARGIVLLNVNPNEVPSDLRERPLTEAAKAIVRSGDAVLTDAIRRASPKYFGDYAATLPPRKTFPVLSQNKNEPNAINSRVKRVIARVTDINNRAVGNLTKEDFEVTEAGEPREILTVEPTTAPFNLVLLLDVSGSVDNYVDFIRKTARNFVNTVSPQDRIAIVIFNEDVKVVSTFTTDKGKLSESLDTFDAGGGTAFYDALAYVLADTLRPFKNDRTAIVILSDGDDNRSFLPFDSLLGSLEESGALIYPLYVPSELIAASAANNAKNSLDPLRSRYNGLTSKAEGEGERLAQFSGGVYYPISQIGDLQKAYEDIAVQLRTAYSITFRSTDATASGNRASPRLKVKVKRENSFVKLGSVVEVKENSLLNLNDDGQNSRGEFYQTKVDFTAPGLPENSKDFSSNIFQTIAFAPNFYQANEISGEVERIKYKQFVNDNLRETKFENFDINKSTGAFVLDDGAEKIAVSRWISPKRTRSYPYERVYDTLAFAGKKATIIPVVKDEGLGGERDFLQWDTISLLSLLNVYFIPAFYSEAVKNEKRADQITAQKFDNNYTNSRLKEIFDFKGTARDWNEREAKQLKAIFEKAKASYAEISRNTKTYLHDDAALNQLIKLAATPEAFAQFSRNKSKRGQSRELQSIQPKEALSTDTKGGVTITNLAGGKYFFTCDETRVEGKTLFLIEDKHSQRAVLPSENDIKDGLLKMMIYTNLKNVRVGKMPIAEKAVLRLTSFKLAGSINSASSDEDAAKFFQANALDAAKQNLIKKLFQEARENNFTIILEHAEIAG